MESGYLGTRGNRREAHRRQMRASVVEAALKLFLERGHLEVAVEDIVDEVGISRATFYKYFSERDEILAELFSQLLGGEPPEPAAEGTAAERIHDLLVATAERMMDQQDLARFVYSVPLRHDAVMPGGTGEPEVMATVRDLVLQGRESGEMRDDVPAEVIGHHLARAFETAMRDWATGRADDAPSRVALLLDVAIGGIAGHRR